MTRFKLHQDVAVVEHDGGQPVENGRVTWGTITQVGSCSVYATYGADDIPRMFLLDSRGRAWNAGGKWRLVPLCHRCQEPITGEPVTDGDDDPLGREWCSDECHDDSGQAWMEQHYRAA